jgi:predicted nucleic acid-binding Zn ribbon protein
VQAGCAEPPGDSATCSERAARAESRRQRRQQIEIRSVQVTF